MKTKDSIRLSPKHGVNPSMPICFFCGEETGEIALLGKINKADDEAPRHILLDYEPCPKCQEVFKQGLLLVEAVPTPIREGQAPISRDLYPTGRWALMKRERAEEIFGSEIVEKGKCLVDSELMDKFLGGGDNVNR